MHAWYSYNKLWPAFAVIAVVSWITAILRPSNYSVIGAVLLTATAIVAFLRGKNEAPTTRR